MVDRAEWLRLYTQFLEVEEELHQALPTVTSKQAGQRWQSGSRALTSTAPLR
jgi:hypothetical protein